METETETFSKPDFLRPILRLFFKYEIRFRLWQCIKINPETNFFKTAIETLCDTKSFQSVNCISLENDISISTARTLRVIDCTLTFYQEIPRFFWDHYKDFFWDQIFGDQCWDFFETQIFETDTILFRPNIFETETFIRLNFFETDTKTFFRGHFRSMMS